MFRVHGLGPANKYFRVVALCRLQLRCKKVTESRVEEWECVAAVLKLEELNWRCKVSTGGSVIRGLVWD